MIPRWGLVEHFDTELDRSAPPREGASTAMVRATLVTTMVVLGAAALVHVMRYGLLLINRTMLLNPLVAGVATWLGVMVSVLAMFAVVASALVLATWLIARRAAAYAHRGAGDPRPVWVLWAGCLVPLVNLVMPGVFVVELAHVEERFARLRRPIVVWWVLWLASNVVSAFSIATSFTRDPQGIADNTLTAIIAYLLALAATVLAAQVYFGFERTPVERPAKRWVMVAAEPAEPAEEREPRGAEGSGGVVESSGQNPAA